MVAANPRHDEQIVSVRVGRGLPTHARIDGAVNAATSAGEALGAAGSGKHGGRSIERSGA